MKITQINSFKIQPKAFPQTKSIKFTPICDVVAFSAQKSIQSDNTSNNIKSAMEIFDKLVKLPENKEVTCQNFKNISKEICPDVNILPIEELKKKIPNADSYVAFYSCHLKPDYTPEEQAIYVDTLKSKGKMERFIFACDSAHELTHAMQVKKGKTFESLKNMSDGNYDYAKLIMGVGDSIFHLLDNNFQAEATLPVFSNFQDIVNIQRYGTILPRESAINPNSIYNGLDVKSEREFNELINSIFEAVFYKIITENNDVKVAMSTLDLHENIESFKKKTKKYCAMKAAEEKEAYTTEVKVAKKFLNTNKSLNIEIRPIYYEKVERALKK